jgi:hypothetical protein
VVSAITLKVGVMAKNVNAIENTGIKNNKSNDFTEDFFTAKRDGVFLYLDKVFFK